MLKTAAFILIALVKTPGEGGIVQIEADTPEQCQHLGRQIAASFRAKDAGNGVAPKVLWSCIERN